MPDIFHSFNTYMEEHNYPLCASDIVKKIVLSSDLFSRKFVDEHGGGELIILFFKMLLFFYIQQLPSFLIPYFQFNIKMKK